MWGRTLFSINSFIATKAQIINSWSEDKVVNSMREWQANTSDILTCVSRVCVFAALLNDSSLAMTGQLTLHENTNWPELQQAIHDPETEYTARLSDSFTWHQQLG